MQPFLCKNQQLILHPSRVVFWEDTSSLIVSDLHFGKTGHFRKSGIAVPQNVYKEDLQRLVSLIQYFNPTQLIIAGDLFHSHHNQELELFKKWRSDLSAIDMHLIKGNHDILHDQWYQETSITVHEKCFETGPFLFCHDAADRSSHINHSSLYSFTGHVHPGISIHGMGRQSLRFPCFYFTESYCVLPAFSRFTGTYSINPNKEENVFAIVDDAIIRMNG
ncbi:MAG TPA: ligase-associated DNA damage response endonuclease PdeM [Chitinophagaceae bacterium]